MTAKRAVLASLLAIVVAGSGCAKLMAGLRRDLDDSDGYAPSPYATRGGTWSERGVLADEDEIPGSVYEDRYAVVGHAERSPASGRYGGGVERRTWISPAHAEDNQRDRYRGGLSGERAAEDEEVASFSANPNVEPPTRRQYKNGYRATRADFVDESQNEGSLWASDGQTNYYFTKNKIRGIGDILTVTVEDGLVRDAVTEVTRTLSPREREHELDLAQARIRAKFLGQAEPADPYDLAKQQQAQGQNANRDQLASAAASASREPAGAEPQSEEAKKAAEELEAQMPRATQNDIDVARALQFKAGEAMMGEIVERYPNGNYKIRATKRIGYRGGFRMLTMVGVARAADISEEDTIGSGKLYEYRLEVVR